MWLRLTLAYWAVITLVRVFFRRLLHGPKHAGWTYRFEFAVQLVTSMIGRGATLMMAGGKPDIAESRIDPRVYKHMRFERMMLAGLHAEAHTSRVHGSDDPVVLYLHGGGYVSCSPATHRDLIARIAVAARARCIAPDYRKAPAHVFPAAVDDALACYRALLDSGVAPSRLFVAGDSAGGGLALALLLRARDEGLPMPRAVALLSPWVDLEGKGKTLHTHGGVYDYLRAEMIAYGAKAYAHEAALDNPLISPIGADLRGLPPMLVQTGGVEVFYDENIELVERARASGVDVVHEVVPGMVHVFQAFAVIEPNGRQAIASIGAFVQRWATSHVDQHAIADAVQPPSPDVSAA